MIPVPPQEQPARRARLALVSSYPTGGSWLRWLLVAGYQLEEVDPGPSRELPRRELPDRAILQLDRAWHPDSGRRLREAGFRTVVLCRHPFDQLLSYLEPTPVERYTRQLLPDQGRDWPPPGATPASEAFLSFALGDPAAGLLDRARAWIRGTGGLLVRYEDLTADPAGELDRIARWLDWPVPEGFWPSVLGVSAMTSIDPRPAVTRSAAVEHQPHRWRALIPSDHLTELFCRHLPLIDELGYPVRLPPPLSPGRAESAWLAGHDPAAA